MTLIQHSADSVEHYTPPEFIEAARRLMGDIDLDPASTWSVNEAHVKASEIFTKEQDGLAWPWHGRVWLNPPGGKLRRSKTEFRFIDVDGGPGESAAAVWWSKLAYEYHIGRVEEAVFLGFTLEILRTSQLACLWAGDFPYCIPQERIPFLQEIDDKFIPGDQPSHANVICYLPPKVGARQQAEKIMCFAELFGKFGKVRA